MKNIVKKNVAIFGLGSDQIYGIKKLKKFFTFGFDDNYKCPGRRYTDKFICTKNLTNNAILNICRKEKIISCFSFSTDYPISLIGWLNDKLKLKSFSSRAASISSNKILFRKILKKNRVLVPNFKNIKIDDLKNLDFKQSKIFKPDAQAGSRGIFIAKNKKEILKSFEKNKRFYKRDLIYENIVSGDKFSIDGWMLKNKFFPIALSKRGKNLKQSYSDKTIIINIQNNFLKKRATQLVEKICKIIKVKNVPIHLEFIKNAKGLYPIDFAIRGAGSHIYSEILSSIINESTAKIQINMTLNQKFEKVKVNKKVFFLHFIYPRKSFFLKKFNRKIFKKIKLKKKIYLFKKENSYVVKSKNSDARIAMLLFYFKSMGDFEKNYYNLKKNLVKIDSSF